jgi:peroxiredoxin (alkyl hydroperoxide reductase subunit C)
MACAACDAKKQNEGYFNSKALMYPPLNATDIAVYDGETVSQLRPSDWPSNRHKLLLFYPETFTPVCSTEMGAINYWVDKFDELGCDIYSVTTDSIYSVKEWYESEESLTNPQYKALSSFILPHRLNILNGARTKRASVIITSGGDVIKQEHFLRVGRSMAELHRMLYAYNTGSYCAEGWQSPEDGFLTP